VARRVARKEVGLFFSSPVAWLFLGSFAALTLFIFFWVESWFARNIADVRPLFEWLPVLLIFLSAAITMRMWSEERRTGTLEHVLTQPVSLWRFTLGKFRACLTLLVLALAATAPLPLTAALIADLDWGPVVAAYLASCLLGATYISAGLFVSARTDNPIVSLIGSVILCGLLFLAGSDIITAFVDDGVAEILRKLGSGARFDSITRGVIDLRDLVYYLSLTGLFLALSVYVLERERWARSAHTPRHRHWRTAIALLAGNLLLVNVWLDRLPLPRLDLTEGRLYTITKPTREILARLEEPLLIRGYFSARNHPLLAPLVPQLRDLLREYALASGGRVRVEFIDPASDPELEQEANDRFGIRATPFQVADRHQAALVNSYFNVLVQYGSEHTTLGFTDLVEVRTAANDQAEVALRNPEYDVTRAIRDVMRSYRSGGDLFAAIDEPVEFIGYVSADELLPDLLLAYRAAIEAELEELAGQSGGQFSVRFVEPEAMGGEIARRIEEEWGFKPMVAALGDEREFFFYLTLADSRQVVQLPTDDFDPDAFRSTVDAGLKRFASDLTRTVALALPPVNEQMARQHLGGPTFINLERAVGRDYNIRLEDLSDGSVVPEADILAIVAPHQLDEAGLFALDQFLMRGGTLILATSPFTIEISGGRMRAQEWTSGLDDWLAHHGLSIGRSLVMDESGALFPTPILRQSGEHQFQDVQMINNPYLVDIRRRGKSREHPVTAGLPQLTMAWASPLEARRQDHRRAQPLLWSSPQSWLSDDLEIMPSADEQGDLRFPGADNPRQSSDLALVVQGRFDSYFANRSPPNSARESEPEPGLEGPGAWSARLLQSPESARIVLYGSNDFMDDQVLNATVAAAGTQYLGPLELFMNTLDWALQDEPLLNIRSRGHFNRTLPPMEARAQAFIEYFNYGLAVLWLVLLALVHWLLKTLRRRRYARGLGL
jgi:ABC-2 type transport system permease protein